MNETIFSPEKYGMLACPTCEGNGFIQNPKPQCCPQCGGFGFIIKEAEEDTNNPKRRIMSPSAKIGGT